MNPADPDNQNRRIAALESEIAELRRRTGIVDPPVGDAPPGRGPAMGCAIAGVVLLLLAGLGALLYAEAWAKVDGVFSSSGGALGRFDAHPTECRSGTAYLPPFLGVELGTTASGHMRVQGTGQSAVVSVFAPGADQGEVFDASRCSTFEVEVTLTGSEVNDVRSVDGRVRMECSQGGGATLSADLRFDACH